MIKRLKRLSQRAADGNLTQKASLNTAASALDYGARLIVGFVVNPMMVTGLGDFGYGVWQFLDRTIGFLNPASGRPTQALKWTIASQQESTDFDEKRRHVGSTVAIWLMFTPILLALGAVLVWFTPEWLDTPDNMVAIVRVATGLLVINLILKSLGQVPQSVLQGENQGYRRMGLTSGLVLAGGGFAMLALWLDSGVIGVSLASLATTILTGALFLQVARAHIPWFGVARPTRKSTSKFLALSGWFLGWNLVMRSIAAGDVLVLGIFDSAELVTTYTLTKYAPGTMVNFIAMVVFGITPGLGGIIGAGDLKRASKVRNEIMLFTWLLSTAVGASVMVWNRSFLSLWVGPQHYAGAQATLLVIIMIVQFVIIRNDANIIDLTLELKQKVLLGLLATGISLGTAIIFVGPLEMGIIGMCLSFIAGRSILSLAYPWLVGRFLGVTMTSQIKGIIRPALTAAAIFVLVFLQAGRFSAQSWPALIISSGSTFVGVSLFAFAVGLSNKQRSRVWRRIRRLIPSSS